MGIPELWGEGFEGSLPFRPSSHNICCHLLPEEDSDDNWIRHKAVVYEYSRISLAIILLIGFFTSVVFGFTSGHCLMRNLSNWGRYRISTGHLLQPDEASSGWDWVAFNWAIAQASPVEIPKHPRLLLSQKIVLHILTARPHCRRCSHTIHWTWRSQAWAYMEPSSLLSCLFGTGMYFLA